jgi:replicative DNA helicase
VNDSLRSKLRDVLGELPNNIEAEQAIAGQRSSIDNRTFDRVATFLEEEHFYEKLHQRIYLVCGELIRMGKTATPITRQDVPADQRQGRRHDDGSILPRWPRPPSVRIAARDIGDCRA